MLPGALYSEVAKSKTSERESDRRRASSVGRATEGLGFSLCAAPLRSCWGPVLQETDTLGGGRDELRRGDGLADFLRIL